MVSIELSAEERASMWDRPAKPTPRAYDYGPEVTKGSFAGAAGGPSPSVCQVCGAFFWPSTAFHERTKTFQVFVRSRPCPQWLLHRLLREYETVKNRLRMAE